MRHAPWCRCLRRGRGSSRIARPCSTTAACRTPLDPMRWMRCRRRHVPSCIRFRAGKARSGPRTRVSCGLGRAKAPPSCHRSREERGDGVRSLSSTIVAMASSGNSCRKCDFHQLSARRRERTELRRRLRLPSWLTALAAISPPTSGATVPRRIGLPPFCICEAVASRDHIPLCVQACNVWVPITRSPHATCTYSWTRPPSRSRRSGRTVAPERGGAPPAGGR